MVAYKQLPISALPEVDYPTIQVITFYPGASPDVMASSVTAPLERQFGQVPGLAADDLHQLGRQFGDHAAIQPEPEYRRGRAGSAAVHQCLGNLPARRIFPRRRSTANRNPADAPILTLALTSDAMPLSKVEDLADTRLAPKISQLPGVGLVSISGGQKPAVRIQANPTLMASYGINLEDLRTRHRGRQREPGQGKFRRNASVLSNWRERPIAFERRL